MIVAYWLLQIFNVVAGMANAALAVWNLARGEYMSAVISSVAAVVLAVSFVKTLRNMARFKFEDREHAERAERLLRTPLSFGYLYPLDPQLELDRCFKRGICPDCAATSLDTTLPITCRNPACGSRFNVDVNGKWSRIRITDDLS
jgi:hypothetical protein